MIWQVFGSFATGLCLHHSDVDVVVVDAPPPEETQGVFGARLLTPLIRALAAALKEKDWCDGLNTIETASMPVIKLRCSPNAEGAPASPPVAIDITIGGKRSESFAGVSQVIVQKDGAGSKPVNRLFEAARNAHNGAAAREFVIERLRRLPALAPLVGCFETARLCGMFLVVLWDVATCDEGNFYRRIYRIVFSGSASEAIFEMPKS